MPERCGSWQSIYGLFRRGQRGGTWAQAWARLQELGDAAGLIGWDVSVLVGLTLVGPDVAELLHAATIAVTAEVPLDRALARGPELGRGCPSSAWVVAMSAEAQPAFTTLMSEEVRVEFYAASDTWLCGAGMQPRPGTEGARGVGVSGRWPYASGCEDAQWAVISVRRGIYGNFGQANYAAAKSVPSASPTSWPSREPARTSGSTPWPPRPRPG